MKEEKNDDKSENPAYKLPYILKSLKSYYNILLYFLVNLNSTSPLKLSKLETLLTIGLEERNQPDNICTVIYSLCSTYIHTYIHTYTQTSHIYTGGFIKI